MNVISVACICLVVALPLFTSCSTLRSGSAVKAAFQSTDEKPKVAPDGLRDRESWAARNIPGWKAVSNFVPPPTEARKKWDEWAQRRSRPVETAGL